MNDTITNLTENLENLADISPETVVDGLGGALSLERWAINSFNLVLLFIYSLAALRIYRIKFSI